MTPEALRAHVLASPKLLKVTDLQRIGRLDYHPACRFLENLESDRLVGCLKIGGVPHWSVTFPVDEERVRELRKLHGKAPRLVTQASNPELVIKRPRISAARVRRHLEEHHPGIASRCARCRK